ncbi:hypothetical protein ACFL96_13635 [Thermoproteota archaeon]
MYSEEELSKIIGYFRDILHPREINEIDDVKKYPNDILMSYVISILDPTKDELIEMLKDSHELNGIMRMAVPKEIKTSDLPRLESGMHYDLPRMVIATSLQNNTGKFSIGYVDKIMVADQSKSEFRYPSGQKIDYFSLSNEIPANIPVLDGGYATPKNNIFIRDNSIKMMLALAEVEKESSYLNEYKKQIDDFEVHVPGIVIAHEISELEAFKKGMHEKMPDSTYIELYSENEAKNYIQEHGIDVKYFELYHLLRASEDQRGKNISQIVVDNGFKPLG